MQLQASSLTYVTILSLVPTLAVVFTLFQMFGGLQGTGQHVQQFSGVSPCAGPRLVEGIDDHAELPVCAECPD